MSSQSGRVSGSAQVSSTSLASLRAAVVGRVEAGAEQLADRMMAAYQHEISAYSQLDDPSALVEVRAGTRMNITLVLRTIATGSPLSDQELSVLKEIGTRRAAQGFPLHALLRAYQVGTQQAWETILDAIAAEAADPSDAAKLVAEISVAIMGTTGQISASVTQAYLETERATAAREERVRRDVFNELLAGPLAVAAPLRERAGRVGYRLGDAHAVIVASADPSEVGIETSLRQMQSSLRTVQLGPLEPIVDVRHSLVVAIVPVPQNAGDLQVRTAVEKALADGTTPGGAPTVAVGHIEGGVSGVATSYRQALRALDCARMIGWTDPVVTYVDALPAMLLLQDVSGAMDLYRATIDPLARADAEQGSQLVTTLAALLEERGNVLAAAKRLFVHRHTLSARLERIEELTRRSLRSRDDLLLLELGMRARRVLPGESASELHRPRYEPHS